MILVLASLLNRAPITAFGASVGTRSSVQGIRAENVGGYRPENITGSRPAFAASTRPSRISKVSR